MLIKHLPSDAVLWSGKYTKKDGTERKYYLTYSPGDALISGCLVSPNAIPFLTSIGIKCVPSGNYATGWGALECYCHGGSEKPLHPEVHRIYTQQFTNKTAYEFMKSVEELEKDLDGNISL